MKSLKWIAVLAGVFVAAACSPKDSAGDGKPLVVATTTMVADMARVIGGDRVKVHGLMGPGVDPHNYVPKLADTGLLEKGEVVLYGGLHLEGKFQESLESMAERGRNVVAVSDGIPPERLLAPQEGFSGTKDPHVWGDPALWIDCIAPVVAALSKADPEGAADFQARGEAYRRELESLDGWAKAKIAAIPEEKRVLVTSHDAFFYFGRAYGFKVRGLQGVSTTAEAGIKDRTNLVEYLRSQGVRTVFSETSLNAKGIAAVAAEAGVEISGQPLFSDALGAPGDKETVDGETYDKGTYTGMLKHNVNAIVKGLK